MLKNLEWIHPLNRSRVKELGEYLVARGSTKIVVFGSSVTSRCHVDSDVDIYAEVEKRERVERYFDFPYDLWTNHDVDERLPEEITRTGVIVYDERDNITG